MATFQEQMMKIVLPRLIDGLNNLKKEDTSLEERINKLEENVQDKRNKYFRIRSNMPKMAEFIAIEKNNLFGDLSEYYDAGDEQYSCGVFCHR